MKVTVEYAPTLPTPPPAINRVVIELSEDDTKVLRKVAGSIAYMDAKTPNPGVYDEISASNVQNRMRSFFDALVNAGFEG